MILVALLLYSIPVTQGIITTIYDWKSCFAPHSSAHSS
jgi:hypothetical protein